ncbi:MAG: M23 family metallopeptidase [Actinomycetota bacterium]|nr:M23 family metallopeptidase [Actinomycetota bacterium]
MLHLQKAPPVKTASAQRPVRRRLTLLLTLLIPLLVAGRGPVPAAVAVATSPATAPALGGGFAAFWQQHDGALLFGTPITGEIVRPSLTVQYFERARLEWHPDWPTGRQITIGRLGAELLGTRVLPLLAPFRSNPGHRYFAATGHSIEGEILRFWDAEGGLPIFGYPLSEEQTEDGRTVQYFERARLEWHPELTGTGYGVLPTPLGALLAPSGSAPPVVLEPPVVQVGHTLLIKVPVPSGAGVTGTLAGLPLAFACCLPLSTVGGAWQEAWALGGVEPELAPSPSALSLTIRSPGGAASHIERTVPVVDYPFPLLRTPSYPYPGPRPPPAAVSHEEDVLVAAFAGRSGPPRWTGLWRQPLAGALEVNAPFGQRRAYGTAPVSVIHGGVDLAADSDTPVHAPAPGTVVLTQYLAERGNTLVLDHGGGVFSLYAHLAEFRVGVGQQVQAGDLIALSNSTGAATTGPHLHWEVHVAGAAVEPLQWLARSFP